MRYMNVYLILLVVLLCNCEKNELISVVAIFRHGARGPIQSYPTSPYKAPSFWPDGYDGQLTNKGKQQMFELGKWLRSRYGDRFRPSEVYVKSTDRDRCIMSGSLMLAGMFPPTGDAIWHSSLAWQPLPVHTVPLSMDPVLAMKGTCPKYERMEKALAVSSHFTNISRTNRNLYAYLSEHSGSNITDLSDLKQLYITLLVEEENKLKLPEWTREVYPKMLQDYTTIAFMMECYTKEMSRLHAGLLFDYIVTHFRITSIKDSAEYKVPGGYKFLALSAHDSTLVNLLMSMDLFQPPLPPVRSVLMFEMLRANSSMYYVNIFYRMGDGNPQKLSIPGCTFDCSLKDFTSLLFSVTIDMEQWKRECNL